MNQKMMKSHEHYCGVDADGHCPECRSRMAVTFKALGEVMAENLKRIRQAMQPLEDWCDLCGDKEADAVFSTIMPQVLDNLDPKLRENVYVAIRAWAQQKFNLKAMPLCDRAYLKTHE